MLHEFCLPLWGRGEQKTKQKIVSLHTGRPWPVTQCSLSALPGWSASAQQRDRDAAPEKSAHAP